MSECHNVLYSRIPHNRVNGLSKKQLPMRSQHCCCRYHRFSIYRGYICTQHFNTTIKLRSDLHSRRHPIHCPYGELWGIFRELYEEKWPRYIESAPTGDKTSADTTLITPYTRLALEALINIMRSQGHIQHLPEEGTIWLAASCFSSFMAALTAWWVMCWLYFDMESFGISLR